MTRTTSLGMTAAAGALAFLVLSGCGGDDPESDDAGGTPASSAESPAAPGDEPGTDLATTEYAIGWEDAVAAAVKDFDGKLAEVGMDTERTPASYKVELVSASEEYTVLVDAASGELSGAQTERLDADDVTEAQNETIDPDRVIAWDEALGKAQAEQTGAVTEWKLEGSDQGPRYQFDFGTGDDDTEVGVNADNGEILPDD